MKLFKYFFTILASLLIFSNISLAEKWDMALAYGAGNFHSANATEFAKNVSEKSDGKLTIVTHPGGSLFKGGEIFRAVRTGQAPIGERFMSALGKEDPLLEIDSQPFLATTYSDAMKLYKASKGEIAKSLDLPISDTFDVINNFELNASSAYAFGDVGGHHNELGYRLVSEKINETISIVLPK